MPTYSARSLMKQAASFFVALNVFFLLSTFRVRDYTDTSLDYQIIIKLALWSAGVGLSILMYRRWIGNALRTDNILLALMILQIFAACLYAPHMNYALACFFSLIATFTILYLASSFLEESEILYTVMLTISLIAFLSIIAYYTVPEFARMGEWVDGERTPGNRLSGITSNPNTIGLMASFALIIAFHYRTPFIRKNFLIFAVCVLLNLIALLMSNSRSSMAAMIVSLTAAYFFNFTPRRLLAGCAMACAAIAFFFLADLDAIMSLVSRSGDTAEIMTATGRTHIWHTAIRLIGESPLIGYGYTSSMEILPQYESEIGHAPPHTHNLYLQILFGMGIPGLLTFLSMFLVKFYYSLKFQDYFKITLLVFLLLHGMTEASIFVGMASLTTIMFGLTYCLEYRKKDRDTDWAE